MNESKAEVPNQEARTHAATSPLRAGWPLVAAMLLVACGGGDSTGSATPEPTNPPSNPSFSVGGSVSGLGSGRSLSLRNNGGSDLTLSANGSFTFPTALASGSAYAVTVLTQPMGQTCTVSNGSGTVSGNVGNVAVTCADVPVATFTVGGTVTGLGSGKSLVLANNGGNDLALSANGSFTFAAAVASGTAYAVTVRTQPAGQTCTVSNGSGTVSGNVGNVEVACAANECAQTLSPGANVGAAITGATAGTTICLRDGNYSGFTLAGVSKNPRVTVQALVPRAASFTSAIAINGNAAGLTIDGVNLAGVRITGANTREITLRNADASKGTIEIDGVTHATPNILFENLEHLNQDNAGFCRGGTAPCVGVGAYHFSFSGRSSPVATIRGAIIDGGCADGVQSGVPFVLEQSQIKNKIVGTCPNDPHTDAAQLYGGPFAGTIIRRNHFLNNVQVIAAYDGVDNVLIEDNVFDPGAGNERRACQIELYSDANSIIRHNTIVYRNATYPGLICLDKKSGFDNGFGTQIYDNIVGGIAAENGSTYGLRRNNLVRSGAIAGEISGSPTYVGGTNPSTWAGFQLTAGSLGKGAASSPSGSDIGSTYFPTTP